MLTHAGVLNDETEKNIAKIGPNGLAHNLDEDVRPHFRILSPVEDQWWSSPAVVVSPEAMQRVRGGVAAQVLARLAYWCSPAKGHQSERTWFRTWYFDDGEGVWVTDYRQIALQLGSTPNKVRRAVEKLVQKKLVTRGPRGNLNLMMTPDAWHLFGRPDGLAGDTTTVTAPGILNEELYRHRVVHRQPQLQQQVYVPTPFVLICEQDFNAAVVLADIVNWARWNAERNGCSTGDLATVWKSWPALGYETGLTRNQLRHATEKLEHLDLLRTHRAIPKGQSRMRRHFQINEAQIDAALRAYEFYGGAWFPAEGLHDDD